MEKKHIKITHKTTKDGIAEIKTESYYDDLAFEQTEYEKIVYTSEVSFFKDLMECANLVTKDQSPEVHITIRSKHGEPAVITKKWVQFKKSYPRR